MKTFGPIWIIPARVKAGEILPLTASPDEIDAAAEIATTATVRLAADGGCSLVMPTARITVEPHYGDDWEQDGVMVQAWSQAVVLEVK